MQTILPLIPAGATPINDIVSVWREGSTWTYFLGMNPVYSHRSDDLRMFCLVIAQLIVTGNCRACQIIETFGISKSRVNRAVRRYQVEGVEGFFEKRARSRRGTVMTRGVIEEAQQRLDAHESRRAISDELGVGYATLVKAIQDGRLKESPKPLPPSGSVKSERSVLDAQASAGMGTACLRTEERLLAALGEIQGAPTRFEACRDVSYGGVLCALPALLGNGLLSGADKLLGQLHGYYQAVHVLLLIGFMALSRIKTPERLRGKAPGEFGKLLGLDRIPEVRCLRNKMDELAQGDAAERWAAELSRTWMQDNPESVGTLYVDGHVRVYHGHQTKLPRKYVSRERLCLRGTNNYWINDAIGRPFFVIEKVVDSGMLKVLREEIVPRLLREVPNQPTQEQLAANLYLCRFILVFDREGYSPDFFRDMWRDHRIACVTYHKHPEAPWPESEFAEQELTMPNGEKITVRLAERGSLLGRPKRQAPEQEEQAQPPVWIREVRKLNPSGHQTSLISTAYLMADL